MASKIAFDNIKTKTKVSDINSDSPKKLLTQSDNIDKDPFVLIFSHEIWKWGEIKNYSDCKLQEMIDKDYNFFFYESNEMKIEEIEKYQTKTVNENNWIGSVYYDIKEYESNKQINYILIGWSGSKSKNYKIIESMFFDKKSQEFKFGYPLFKLNNKILNRYIIKYYLQSKLTLKFYNNETIVFDQLKENDINPIPDGGYNALILKNKKWMLKENFIPKNKIKLKKRKKINNNLFPN